MIDNNGKLRLPFEFIRENKRLLIDSNEQVIKHNTKCPNCASVLTVSEAFTKPCTIGNEITVPAFDEKGVIIGECSMCNEKFVVNVTNPEFAEFNNGATKVDYYFDVDGETKKELYKYLLVATSRVIGDNKLNQYCLDYIYDEYPIYICNRCGENLERLSLHAFKEKFESFQKAHFNYVNWSLKNACGRAPEYIIVKLGFKCFCGNQCKSFFFKKYIETFNVEIGGFSICNVMGALGIGKVIASGVYSKDNSISWLYKLIPRWTLLFDRVYIITPFIGHQWLKPAQLMGAWLELVNRLDHKKSTILLKSGQFSSFRKAYSSENNESYEKLSEFELGSDLLSELKQANDFHAKIYCGISQDKCEVFSGSANLVKGKSMEVMHFNTYDNFDDFNEAFLAPLGIEEDLKLKINTRSLFFDSDTEFNIFLGKGEMNSSEYINTILQKVN